MTRTALFHLAAACLVLAAAGAALAYKVPDTIVIKRPADNTPLASWVGDVTFPHGEHAIDNPCKSCHHKESDKTPGEFVSCTQCHKKDDPRDDAGFFRAWHAESSHSCLGCHTMMRAKDGKNPVGCTTACHKPIK